jgi:hypothetical protein
LYPGLSNQKEIKLLFPLLRELPNDPLWTFLGTVFGIIGVITSLFLFIFLIWSAFQHPGRRPLMFEHMRTDQEALGAPYQLGNHRATYKPSMISQVTFWSFIFILGCVCLFAAFTSLHRFSNFIWLCLGGLSFVGIALYGSITAYQNRVLRVFVYDYGFIHVGSQSRQALSWQNVEAVWHKVKIPRLRRSAYKTFVHTYIVDGIDGIQLKLDNTFAHLRDLGRSLEVGTAPYIFPRVLKTYQMSQPVLFGPLTVTTLGLSYSAETLPWTEMKSIKIDEYIGEIVIKKHEKLSSWASIDLGNLPNVEVFRMLIQHITGRTPSTKWGPNLTDVI